MKNKDLKYTMGFALELCNAINANSTLYTGLVKAEYPVLAPGSEPLVPEEDRVGFFNRLFLNFEDMASKSIDYLSIDSLVEQSKKYDFIIGDLPFGMPLRTWKNKYKIQEEWIYILKLMSLLNNSGYGLFWVAPLFWFGRGLKFREILKENNFHLYAAIDPPKGILKPYSSLQPSIIILSHQKVDKLFIAEILDASNTNKIANNIVNQINGNDLINGLQINIDEFAGFNNYRNKREIKNLSATYKDYREYKLLDVAKEVILGKQNQSFEDKNNAIYLPRIGTSKVISDLKNLKLKTHNYFQINLDETIISNKFASLFYSSDLGKAIIKSLFHDSFIPHISKQALNDAIIAVPTLKQQKIIIDTYEKIERLQEVIDTTSKELSINPNNAENLQDILDNALIKFSNFTKSDEIKSIIRKRESKIREFKETLSLDVKKNTKEKYIEKSVLKTIAAFLNTDGGDLLIGVRDDYIITGVDKEIQKFHKNNDKYLLHLKNLIKRSIGEGFYPLINSSLVKVDNKYVLWIVCERSDVECFLNKTDFYVRTNPATDKIEGPELISYIKNRFS